MNCCLQSQSKHAKGLTFLEVLLTVAMLGLLMVGGSTLLYSFTRTYFNLETGPQFERHADGIAETLNYLASQSTAPTETPGVHYQWLKSPITQQTTIAFSLDQDLPLFVSDLVPLPSVKAYLEFQKEENQFWLVWLPDPKRTNNTPVYQYTLLSEWASDIEYGYYDLSQKTWEFELASADSRTKGEIRPDRMELIFEREGQTLRRTLKIQTPSQNVLTY